MRSTLTMIKQFNEASHWPNVLSSISFRALSSALIYALRSYSESFHPSLKYSLEENWRKVSALKKYRCLSCTLAILDLSFAPERQNSSKIASQFSDGISCMITSANLVLASGGSFETLLACSHISAEKIS